MRKIITIDTYRPYSGVTIPGKSECVPSQSLTVQEILRRFQSGTMDERILNQYNEFDDDKDLDGLLDDPDPLYRPDFDLADATNIVSQTYNQQKLFFQSNQAPAAAAAASHVVRQPAAAAVQQE